jgi:hypothetical protein
MSKPCSICNSRDRAAIDERMIRGEAVAAVARAFDKSESALRRHREHIAKAVALVQQDHASNLKVEIEELKAELTRIQAEGKADGDWKRELAAFDRRLRLLELQARTSGEMKDQSTGTTNVLNINLDERTARKMAETFIARARLKAAGGAHD